MLLLLFQKWGLKVGWRAVRDEVRRVSEAIPTWQE